MNVLVKEKTVIISWQWVLLLKFLKTTQWKIGSRQLNIPLDE